MPGHYTIRAEPDGPESKYTGRVELTVAQQDVDNVRLVVNRGFSFSGFVSMDDGTTIPAGPQMPVNDKIVELEILGLLNSNRRSQPQMVPLSRSDGTFAVDGVPAGRYGLSIQRLLQKLYIKSIKLGNQDIQGPLDLSYGSLSNVRIVLGTDAGEVRAVVRDRNGQAMAGVFVVPWPEPRNPDPSDRPFFGSVLETDENGTVFFDILPPGKYRLVAFTDVDRALAQSLDFLEYFQNRAITFEVGKSGSVERTLEPVGSEAVAAALRNLP